MKRVLVPLDGSDFAEGALSTAAALAIRDGAELRLLSVVSTEPPVPFGFTDEALVVGWVEEETALMQAYLTRVAARVAADSEDLHVTTSVHVGGVGATIKEVSEALDVDLIVLTTHGRGAFGRAWLGGTADHLLRSLERPVLLLPRTPEGRKSFAEDQIRHVLVPLDGSEAAETALAVLPLLLSGSGDVRLTLASVVEDDLTLPAGYPRQEIAGELLAEERRQREAYLEAVSRRVKEEGIGTPETRLLMAASAARGLLRYCEETDVDAIALSTHGRGGVARLVIGSVADKVIRGAGIPVLAVRQPQRSG